MKVGFVADVHFGNHRSHGGEIRAGLNDRCRAVASVFDEAATRARAAKCSHFVVLGDLFDESAPVPQIITPVMETLYGKDKTRSVVVRGNHDMDSDARGDHALGPLGFVADVVEDPTWFYDRPDGRMLLIPFQPGRAREWFPEVVAEACKTQKEPGQILGFHLGVIDEETPPFLRDCDDAVPLEMVVDVCAKHGFKFAFCGNWHHRKKWHRGLVTVVQVGALVPTGWDNPGLRGYGTLAIVDTVTGLITLSELTGPRFVKADGLDDVMVNALVEQPQPGVYLRWTLGADEMEAGRARELPCVVEIIPSSVEAKAAARTAAAGARAAGTLTEALHAFVASMKLDDGTNRASVLARARKYLGT